MKILIFNTEFNSLVGDIILPPFDELTAAQVEFLIGVQDVYNKYNLSDLKIILAYEERNSKKSD